MKKSIVLGTIGLLLVAGFVWSQKHKATAGRTLHLYIYANYIEPSIIQQFKDEYGVDVVEENSSSNEEVEGKLKAGASGYDLITPSDYMVKRLISAGLLAPLDRSQLPNLKHLAARFQKPAYDPEGAFSVPYMWGTTGIGYNKRQVKDAPHSWAQFFDPSWLASLQQRVSLLDDPREVIGAALKRDGQSINATDDAALAKAKQRMQSILPSISRIDSNSYKDLLASGDLWLVHGYSGDIIKLQASNPDIAYIIPDEGGTIWADNLAIPSQAPNKDLAMLFIDFVMRPEINAKIASYIRYATTNQSAMALLPKDQLENPNIYPSPAMQDKLEWFADLGDKSEAFDQLWNEVRSSSGSVSAVQDQTEKPSPAPDAKQGAG